MASSRIWYLLKRLPPPTKEVPNVNWGLGSQTIPPYATRMATARLLMETELYDLALEVLDRLREEDDQVVDLWYLGGWGLYCKGEKAREEEEKSKAKGKEVAKPQSEEEEEEEDWQSLWAESRQWLNVCAKVTTPTGRCGGTRDR